MRLSWIACGVLVVASPALAECKVVLSGAVSREFACKAELWKRSAELSQLVVTVRSDQPFDVSAMVSFVGAPAAGSYGFDSKKVDAVDVLARDKKAKGIAAWTASLSRKPAAFSRNPTQVPAPRGDAKVELAGVAAQPEVHGTVTATLKADEMNAATGKGDVTATFSF